MAALKGEGIARHPKQIFVGGPLAIRAMVAPVFHTQVQFSGIVGFISSYAKVEDKPEWDGG